MNYRLTHRYLPITSNTNNMAADGCSSICFENQGDGKVMIKIDESSLTLEPGDLKEYNTNPGEKIYTVWNRIEFAPGASKTLLFITKEFRSDEHICQK